MTALASQQIRSKQEQTAAARERLGKHVPVATDMHMRMNGVVCYKEVIRKTIGATKSVLYGSLKKRVCNN
jgi:hypothetical protein